MNSNTPLDRVHKIFARIKGYKIGMLRLSLKAIKVIVLKLLYQHNKYLDQVFIAKYTYMKLLGGQIHRPDLLAQIKLKNQLSIYYSLDPTMSKIVHSNPSLMNINGALKGVDSGSPLG